MIRIIISYKVNLKQNQNSKTKRKKKVYDDTYEKRVSIGNKIAGSLTKKHKDLKIVCKIYNDYMYIYGYRSIQ